MPKVVSVFGIEPFRIGGNETFARELSLQLHERGWESVLCFLTPPTEEVRAFLQLPNVTIEIVENSTGVSLSGSLAFCRILRKHRPEVVHLHFINFLTPLAWLAKILGVGTIFFTDHGSRPAGYIPRRAPLWKRILVRIINWPVTKIICVSNYGYSCFTKLDLLPVDRFKMIYNSVDLSRVHPTADRGALFRKKFEICPDRTVVLQVSWIIPEKGIPALMEAARLVLKQTDKIHFVFAGEGSYRTQYMTDAEKLGIQRNVTWAGLIKDPFNEGVYDAADILCQVSDWEEVFGWVIAEAMSYQKPVIGTKVGGIPELVEDSITGFLVERGDSEAMARRVLQLASNLQQRVQMGELASAKVKQKFNLEKNVGELVEAYSLDSKK